VQDPDAHRAAQALLNAQKELQRVLAQSPSSVQRYADQALGNVAELEQAGARLIARADELSRYLDSVDFDEARTQFTSARAQREQQRKTLDELVAARDRVSANLSRIVATYESLPARVVHMRALDAQAVDAFSGDVNQELDRMNHEIAAFEDTLKGLSTRVSA
jgi:chromosome segregation ATPase